MQCAVRQPQPLPWRPRNGRAASHTFDTLHSSGGGTRFQLALTVLTVFFFLIKMHATTATIPMSAATAPTMMPTIAPTDRPSAAASPPSAAASPLVGATGLVSTVTVLLVAAVRKV